MALLEVRDLRVLIPLGGHLWPAVDGLSFDLDAGESLGIVGESGSGKSMAALAVIGLVPDLAQVQGSVRLDGEDLLGLTDRAMSRIRGRRIGMVFQEPMTALDPVRTIGAQVAEGVRWHHPVSWAEAARQAADWLARVGLDPDRVPPSRYPHELSGGQRQRAMIAAALAPGPDLLILDEATTALDVTTQAEVLGLVAEIAAERGTALLVISHDLGVIARMTDRMLVLYRGAAVEAGTTAALFRRMAHPYTRGLFGAMPSRDLDRPPPARLAAIPGTPPALTSPRTPCLFAPRCPIRVPICAVAPPLVVPEPGHGALCWRAQDASTAFRPIAVAPPTAVVASGERLPAAQSETAREQGESRPGPDGEPLLLVDRLGRTYPGKRSGLFGRAPPIPALDAVSFSLTAGEALGVVGESGSGKSTLARLLLGLDRPSAGRVVVAGTNLGTAPREVVRALRRRMQIVFQDPNGSLDPRFPVEAIVAEPLVGLMPGLDRQARRERVIAALEQVGLEGGVLRRRPHAFSGGQRQRIAIARALVTDPDLLVLDEPVSALDVSIQAQILNLLADLRARRQLALILISHDLSVVRSVTERVLVLYRGRIVEQGPTGLVFAHPRHPYTQALVAAVPRADPTLRPERKTGTL